MAVALLAADDTVRTDRVPPADRRRSTPGREVVEPARHRSRGRREGTHPHPGPPDALALVPADDVRLREVVRIRVGRRQPGPAAGSADQEAVPVCAARLLDELHPCSIRLIQEDEAGPSANRPDPDVPVRSHLPRSFRSIRRWTRFASLSAPRIVRWIVIWIGSSFRLKTITLNFVRQLWRRSDSCGQTAGTTTTRDFLMAARMSGSLAFVFLKHSRQIGPSFSLGVRRRCSQPKQYSSRAPDLFVVMVSILHFPEHDLPAVGVLLGDPDPDHPPDVLVRGVPADRRERGELLAGRPTVREQVLGHLADPGLRRLLEHLRVLRAVDAGAVGRRRADLLEEAAERVVLRLEVLPDVLQAPLGALGRGALRLELVPELQDLPLELLDPRGHLLVPFRHAVEGLFRDGRLPARGLRRWNRDDRPLQVSLDRRRELADEVPDVRHVDGLQGLRVRPLDLGRVDRLALAEAHPDERLRRRGIDVERLALGELGQGLLERLHAAEGFEVRPIVRDPLDDRVDVQGPLEVHREEGLRLRERPLRHDRGPLTDDRVPVAVVPAERTEGVDGVGRLLVPLVPGLLRGELLQFLEEDVPVGVRLDHEQLGAEVRREAPAVVERGRRHVDDDRDRPGREGVRVPLPLVRQERHVGLPAADDEDREAGVLVDTDAEAPAVPDDVERDEELMELDELLRGLRPADRLPVPGRRHDCVAGPDELFRQCERLPVCTDAELENSHACTLPSSLPNLVERLGHLCRGRVRVHLEQLDRRPAHLLPDYVRGEAGPDEPARAGVSQEMDEARPVRFDAIQDPLECALEGSLRNREQQVLGLQPLDPVPELDDELPLVVDMDRQEGVPGLLERRDPDDRQGFADPLPGLLVLVAVRQLQVALPDEKRLAAAAACLQRESEAHPELGLELHRGGDDLFVLLVAKKLPRVERRARRGAGRPLVVLRLAAALDTGDEFVLPAGDLDGLPLADVVRRRADLRPLPDVVPGPERLRADVADRIEAVLAVHVLFLPSHRSLPLLSSSKSSTFGCRPCVRFMFRLRPCLSRWYQRFASMSVMTPRRATLQTATTRTPKTEIS